MMPPHLGDAIQFAKNESCVNIGKGIEHKEL